jgi:hypothetical protein
MNKQLINNIAIGSETKARLLIVCLYDVLIKVNTIFVNCRTQFGQKIK